MWLILCPFKLVIHFHFFFEKPHFLTCNISKGNTPNSCILFSLQKSANKCLLKSKYLYGKKGRSSLPKDPLELEMTYYDLLSLAFFF